MKKQLLMKTFLVAVCLLGGANFAWADDTTFEKDAVIGSETEPGGWWYASSNVIDIPKNKTLILKFKTYSATDEQLKGKGENGADLAWGSYMSHLLRIGYQKSGENNDIYDLRWRADGYGWVEGNGTTGDKTAPSWLVYNGSNTRWGTDGAEFRQDITGSTVTLTIQRFGTELRIAQDIAATSGNYRKYLVVSTEYEGFMWAQIALERAYIKVLENAYTVNSEDALTGTLIGTLNNAKGGLKDQAFQTFPLAANGKLTLHFKNYTNKLQIWNNFVVEITDNTHFVDLRGDGAGWQWAENWGTYTPWWNESGLTKTGYPATNYEYMKAMDGADVVATVTRSGATFTISASITPVSESSFSEEYTFTDGNLTDNTVYVNLLCEGGHLDLLPVTKTITSAGWATYCSPYALNLAGASATLEDAYIVTGGNDGVLTLTSVKNGTVPANTGLLLKGSEGTVTIPIVGSSTTNVAANKLVGVTEPYELAANGGYVLMGSSSVGFYKNSNAFTVGANTAYLPAGFDATTARSFYSFGDATAIKAIDNSSTSEAAKSSAQFAIDNYYNVAGQRVAAPTKGLYIKNGKKIVVK